MLALILFLLCLGSALADYHNYQEHERATHLFDQFMNKYNKNYRNFPEMHSRFQIFMENLEKIKYYNKLNGDEVMGINIFSDLTEEEFKRTYHNCTFPKAVSNCTRIDFKQLKGKMMYKAPPSFDWRQQGVVTPVKDQGKCGSCWAFSTIGNQAHEEENCNLYPNPRLANSSAKRDEYGIYHSCYRGRPVPQQWSRKWADEEGELFGYIHITELLKSSNVESQYALKHNQKQLDLSEQQEVDCDKSNSGCNGGWMSNALLNLKEEGGLMAEQDYPYTGQDAECLFEPNKVQVKVTGCLDFSGASEEDIKDILVNYGPLTVALDASTWGYYTTGVFKNCKSNINHALLVVGYGTDERTNVPYWIVKNSWAQSWGEDGYIRIVRGKPECIFGKYNLVTAVVD